MELKKVKLNDIHESLGAKMVPFAGYNMPVRYISDKEEHLQVRNAVGVFDVSHMGEFMVEGTDALALVQKVTSNDAAKLQPGKIQYSCLPNDKGGLVDDLLVYMMAENKYFLVVNASNIDKDWDWINSHNDFKEVKLTNVSDDWSLFAVQGPKAIDALQPLTEINLRDMGYYTFEQAEFAGKNDVIISATGYTGSGGFEIYVKNDDAVEVWNAIFESGKNHGIKPIGLGARDTLRMEMGFCLYGNDIDDSTSPLEAGLGWITKFSKDFINSDNLKAQKEAGNKKKLVGFEMIDRGIPRAHYELVNDKGEKIGEVTSGTQSPSLDKGIGMGYLPMEYTAIGTEIFVRVRNKNLKACVVSLPFYKNK